MRRLACLLLPLGIACSAPATPGYPGEYLQQSGANVANTGDADGGSTTNGGSTPSQPQQPGSTPSPITHHDGGAWGPPDSGAVTPSPVTSDGGTGSPPQGDDAGTAATPTPGDDAGSGNATLLATCAGGINSFRGQNGLSPYTISTTLERFAAQAAASDAQSGQEDGFFNQNGGNNVSFGEDELVGQQVDPGGTATQVFNQGLLDEENGYIDGNANLLSQQFSQVGCGVAQASDGSYWIAIEYR